MSNELGKYADLLKQIKEDHENGGSLSDPNDKILLIDGLNNFIRVFSAVPALNDDGVHIGGIIGFLKSVGAMIKQYRPTRCIIVFDGKGGNSRRKKIYKEYKEGRNFKLNVNRINNLPGYSNQEEAMAAQFKRLIQYLDILPVTTMAVPNVEADDVIAYLATDVYPESEKIIASTDKDFLQLVNEKTTVWSPVKKKHIESSDITEQYGVPVDNLLMCRMFEGDTSDNISGVNGVGMKTLLSKVPIVADDTKHTVEDIINYCKKQIEDGSKYKIYQKIIDNEDILHRNYELMNLVDHDFAGNIKLDIHTFCENIVTPLDKASFRQMIITDRMTPAFPNLDYWMGQVFDNLNAHALLMSGK